MAESERGSGEAGVSLAELLTTISLIAVVLSAFLGVLVSVQSGLVRQVGRSGSNDNARLAVEELDREIRSSNVLYDPGLESDATHGIYPGMSLRIYTQANAPTRAGGGFSGERCVQWRIYGGQLQRRDWPKDSSVASGWTIVAEHVLNQTVSPPKPAFALDTASSFGRRIVNVAIVVNNNGTSGNNVEVNSGVTGRNTQYGYPVGVCATIPPYPS